MIQEYCSLVTMLSKLTYAKLLSLCNTFQVATMPSPNVTSTKKRQGQHSSSKKRRRVSSPSVLHSSNVQESHDVWLQRHLSSTSDNAGFVNNNEWWLNTQMKMSFRSLIQTGFEIGSITLDDETIGKILTAVKKAFMGGQLKTNGSDIIGENNNIPRDPRSTIVCMIFWYRYCYEKLKGCSNLRPIKAVIGKFLYVLLYYAINIMY